MKVKDVMTKDPITIEANASVRAALDVMHARGIHHLPVLDDEGALVGVVSDQDLQYAAFSPAVQEHLSVSALRRNRGLADAVEHLRIKDVMTWTGVTTGPEAPLMYAALIMYEKRVSCLPIVEGPRLVGLLTERDLLRALVQEGDVSEFGGEGFMWQPSVAELGRSGPNRGD